MDFLSDLAHTIRAMSEGATWAELWQVKGFQNLEMLAATIVPPTIIALGIGMTEWRETPLGAWLGLPGKPDDEHWAERARDLDKDGLEDF